LNLLETIAGVPVHGVHGDPIGLSLVRLKLSDTTSLRSPMDDDVSIVAAETLEPVLRVGTPTEETDATVVVVTVEPVEIVGASMADAVTTLAGLRLRIDGTLTVDTVTIVVVV
jgi:hypothetical protein